MLYVVVGLAVSGPLVRAADGGIFELELEADPDVECCLNHVECSRPPSNDVLVGIEWGVYPPP